VNAALRRFVTTSEHERFEEFCEACRRDRYIGLCFGSPGVGKTVSARAVSGADAFEALRAPFSDHPDQLAPLRGRRALFYTPDVINGPRAVTDHILGLWNRLLFVEAAGLIGPAKERQERQSDEVTTIVGTQSRTVRDANKKLAGIADALVPKPFLHPLELLIVDEADRLKTASLEQLRHLFDRGSFGLVLIGMPGLEKRLARYPQLYSRIGFAHQYRALPIEELRNILIEQLPNLVAALPCRGLEAPDVLAAILRITSGNLRLAVRLLAQIARILEVNDADTVSVDIVNAARDDLVIGTI
jgi:DNA transposition AAA+ family ATPase